MSTYFIGDIHGCYTNLRTILDNVQFNINTDTLYLTGDLVARGPKSLEVLRWVKNLANNAKMVLGNHDLYLLQTYFGKYNQDLIYSFRSILNAPDVDELMHWLQQQSILYVDENKKIIMSHAGIHPDWNIKQAKFFAQEIENILISDQPNILFCNAYQLNQLKKNNINIDKLKKIQNNINSFTKMRYVYLNGCLDFKYKDIPEYAPKDIYPWFNLSKFRNSNYNIIFGHWAALENTHIPVGFYGLDSGCCWGRHLTLLRWEDKKIIKIACNPPH